MVNKLLTTLDIASDKLTRDDVFTLNDTLQHNKTLKFLDLTEEVAKTVDKHILPCDWQSAAHLDQHNEFMAFRMNQHKTLHVFPPATQYTWFQIK